MKGPALWTQPSINPVSAPSLTASLVQRTARKLSCARQGTLEGSPIHPELRSQKREGTPTAPQDPTDKQALFHGGALYPSPPPLKKSALSQVSQMTAVWIVQ